ncbi:MAG: sulfurtransferase-like selenium metabolism protein YedF [Clostridia bacterium]|nr:sulfurtransferase-like selenium metabolism protein YedF [Clostridia bacterium]
MKTIDARGLSCPKPVVLTKKEMESHSKIITIVDNEIAKQNVERLANNMDYDIDINKKDEDYYIALTKTGSNEKDNLDIQPVTIENPLTALLLSSDKLGKGSEELGKILMKGYLYTLTEIKPYPSSILMMNEGVKLATENEDAIKNLKKMEEEGVEIIVCGTCLDYYQCTDDLKVGIVGNMYSIVEKMNQAQKLIHI